MQHNVYTYRLNWYVQHNILQLIVLLGQFCLCSGIVVEIHMLLNVIVNLEQNCMWYRKCCQIALGIDKYEINDDSCNVSNVFN